MVSMSPDTGPERLWTADAIHSPNVIWGRYRPRMPVTSRRRAELLTALAYWVRSRHPARRLRVAVDGVDGAGKTVLADELADRIMAYGRPAVRASIDGFHRPRAERYRLGRTSPEGFQAGADTVLVFDGIFLHRSELREQWDFSIFLQVGFDVSVARCASRDGTSPDPFAGVNQRYVEGQRRYFHDARPWRQATVVVDNTNLAEPSIVAPDRVTLGWNP
jgi:uridine kinase